MAHEALQPQIPHPAEAGLTPEQQQIATELFANAQEAHRNLADIGHSRDDYAQVAESGVGLARSFNDANFFDNSNVPVNSAALASGIVKALGDHKIRKAAKVADKAARKHYRENAGAYQEQALKEAGDDGFKPKGWSQE